MKKVGANNPFGVTDCRVKPATEVQIAKLEKRIGAKLPKDYRHFLMTINGGRRPGGGWELPKHGLVIDTFYGLRKDFYDLEEEVIRVLRCEPGTSHYPPDAFPIGYELGNNPIIMKYRGKDSGSVWFWDEMGKEDWRKVATSFNSFTSMLHQEREQNRAANLRDIIERDDIEAMRRYVASLSTNKLDEPDESTGHSIVQRAADAGAAKIVAFLIDCGARGIVGLGTVNVKRHTKVIKLLLTRGQYLPTEYDWQGAAAFGGTAAIRLYFEHAPPPPRKVLKTLVQATKNLMKSKPCKEREQILAILEACLVSSVNVRGYVRKLNVKPRRKS